MGMVYKYFEKKLTGQGSGTFITYKFHHIYFQSASKIYYPGFLDSQIV